MSTLSLRCITAAFVCLALGLGLGVSFAAQRALGATLRPLHVELNLWGWSTLLIYGFAYHMLPRFAGRPLGRPRLAATQAGLAIGGVALAVLGWAASAAHIPYALLIGAAGALAQLIAALLFGWQIGRLLLRS
ncbi:MAG TPA: hypothetical protein VFU22_21965 [Roseiflexaceae bacterium]|nr:hypothetical protein [Roseiflexaceae bacterium]